MPPGKGYLFHKSGHPFRLFKIVGFYELPNIIRIETYSRIVQPDSQFAIMDSLFQVFNAIFLLITHHIFQDVPLYEAPSGLDYKLHRLHLSFIMFRCLHPCVPPRTWLFVPAISAGLPPQIPLRHQLSPRCTSGSKYRNCERIWGIEWRRW